MTRRLNLPDTASVAYKADHGRLSAPSALRNVDGILNVLKGLLPKSGKALEIASGTGEHILRFGHAFPGIIWQPSDMDIERHESISAWQANDGSDNVLAPIHLSATEPGWSDTHNSYDVILLANLLHLISGVETETVVTQATKALIPGGICMFYGPFKRDAVFASEGDRAFHESLSGQDPAIGYKSFQQVQEWQRDGGLKPALPIEMPANNLMLVARKPG